MTTTADWPFGTDADHDDPLTAHRIAVTSPWSQWCYLVAFDRDSTARPTDAETLMLGSFLREHIDRWYDDGYKAKLAQRPLDVDGSANGITFRKYGEDDWGYRRRTWQYGPTFVPEAPYIRERCKDAPVGPLTLVQVMDRAHTLGDDKPMQHWLDWKAAHPEVFPA